MMEPAAMGQVAPAASDQLDATRCTRCGLVTSPPERYGCEACGALPADHEAVTIDTAGTVKSYATVWRHAKPTPPTPYTVVQVVLDAGPALKGVLEDDVAVPRIGDRVRGRVEQTTEGPLLRWEPFGGDR